MFAVTARLRWPMCSPIRAHGTPPRCKREIRRCRRSCGEKAGTPAAVQARAIAVRKRSAVTPRKTRAPPTRSSRGRRSSTAWNSGSGTATQRARPVFATACETRQRPRGSSTSPHVGCSSSPTRIPVESRTSSGNRYRGGKSRWTASTFSAVGGLSAVRVLLAFLTDSVSSAGMLKNAASDSTPQG